MGLTVKRDTGLDRTGLNRAVLALAALLTDCNPELSAQASDMAADMLSRVAQGWSGDTFFSAKYGQAATLALRDLQWQLFARTDPLRDWAPAAPSGPVAAPPHVMTVEEIFGEITKATRLDDKPRIAELKESLSLMLPDSPKGWRR